jgi:hypothetical protein
MFEMVSKGNALLRNLVGEKLDNGFLGIGQSLSNMMDELINHVVQYFDNPNPLAQEIENLKDISEYNNYMRKKLDDSIILEEEILVLNQNQPSLEQLNDLFTQQDAKFEEIKIQLFNESSTIHEELKEFKEAKSRKLNVDAKLDKVKNSIIAEIKYIGNKLLSFNSEVRLIPEEVRKSFNTMQRNIYTKLDNFEPLKTLIEDSMNNMMNRFESYMQNDVVKRFDDNGSIGRERTILFDQVKNYMQNEIITRIEDREPFSLIITDNISRMANDLKNYIHNLEIETGLDLINTLIQDNTTQILDKLIEGNNFNMINFEAIQTSLKRLPSFKDMENFFERMILMDDVVKQFEAQHNFIDNFQDNNIHILF